MRILKFSFVLLILALWAGGGAARNTGKEIPIEIKSAPIPRFDLSDPGHVRFGDLEYRGGLILTCSNSAFGGFSALRMQSNGSHFIALSDHSNWLRGRVIYEGIRPAAIADAVMAPVLFDDLQPSGRLDSESLAEDRGILYVGVEGRNQILRFNYKKSGFQAIGKPIAVPPGIKTLPGNQGLEALVFVPKPFPQRGTLIAISERGLNEAGDIKAFLMGGRPPGAFSVKRSGNYDVSDAALLPSGDLLILERRYSLTSGVSVRIRRIKLAEIRPGVTVDGPSIFEVDGRCAIDNAEALSVHRSCGGQIILTLLTDDNFSPLQKTLLLQFTLAESNPVPR